MMLRSPTQILIRLRTGADLRSVRRRTSIVKSDAGWSSRRSVPIRLPTVPVDIRCQSETAERNLRLISSLISAGAARPFPKPVLLRNTFCILEQAVSGKCRAQAPKEVGLL
uniref:(northern house mosquito) hypothetical protein n=1 Tax=Culex pipiens TaxID=7175 RepID=A0A8D8I5W8_CULPI